MVVALTLGGLTGFQIVHVTPVNSVISELPIVLIPTVGVPLLLALHIVSLRQLRAAPGLGVEPGLPVEPKLAVDAGLAVEPGRGGATRPADQVDAPRAGVTAR
jgi:hypothetical protein